MPTIKKEEQVNELRELVTKSKAIVFVDYKGLKHKQMEELRKSLKKVDAKFKVTKNRLMLRSIGENGKLVEKMLNDTTATLFAMGDEAQAVKELSKFLKTANLGKTRGGLLGEQVMESGDVVRLATLPSREILLGKIAGGLKSPLYGLHYALSWNINKLVWALNAVKAGKN